jgi:hypothetical protein
MWAAISDDKSDAVGNRLLHGLGKHRAEKNRYHQLLYRYLAIVVFLAFSKYQITSSFVFRLKDWILQSRCDIQKF